MCTLLWLFCSRPTKNSWEVNTKFHVEPFTKFGDCLKHSDLFKKIQNDVSIDFVQNKLYLY